MCPKEMGEAGTGLKRGPMINLLRKFKPKLVIEVHNGVDRDELLRLVESAGYLSHATPIEPIEGEVEAQFVDDHSYVFLPV